jgi:four helix bundle protein
LITSEHSLQFRVFSFQIWDLGIANGSLAELDTQRIIAEELKLIDHERSVEPDLSITEVRKMLYALKNKLNSG